MTTATQKVSDLSFDQYRDLLAGDSPATAEESADGAWGVFSGMVGVEDTNPEAEVEFGGEVLGTLDTREGLVTICRRSCGTLVAVCNELVVGGLKQSGMVCVYVADEYAGMGIGTELVYHYRKAAPFAHAGGFSAGGEAMLRKVYRRLVAEGL